METYSTILVKSTTRESLKDIGKKGQTYDEIIYKLLKQHDDSFESKSKSSQLDESSNL
ncbi:MAG: hypothetical protein WBL68_04660 [Nitrososphaeraceae archaeon]|jgi:hypothetical protein